MDRPHASPALTALVLAATIFAMAPAQAAGSVYRCTVNGKVLYADEPCSNQAREVSVNDTRSREQRQDAQESARREAAMARQMRRDRLEEERLAAKDKRGPAGIHSTGGVEYSNAGGKVTKTVKPRKTGPKFDDAMPIYIDVPTKK